jgi:hypothetical protein
MSQFWDPDGQIFFTRGRCRRAVTTALVVACTRTFAPHFVDFELVSSLVYIIG